MARKPPRKRNYKAEYERRQAKGRAAGKTRQQARGHKPREHVERARQSQAKYGASPSTMTRLRREAASKLLAIYKTIAKNPVNETTVARGMRLLHADDLRELIARDSIDTVSMLKEISPLRPSSASYLEQLEQYFPESIDDIDDAEWNPGWYR